MTVNIDNGAINAIRIVQRASAPAALSGSVRLYANNETLAKLSIIDDDGTVTKFLGNSSGSGTGITFPATQDASSDANTLDDYEEGTWTPTPTGWTGVTYTTQQGRYTKIGNHVTAWFRIQFSGTSAATAVTITGLPFAVPSSTSGGALSYYNVAVDTNGIVIQPLSTTILLYANATTGAVVNSNGNVTSKFLIGFVTYQQ